MLRSVDLEANRELMGAYCALWNKFVDELMTVPITPESTEKWMENKYGRIRCLVEDGRLLGAVIVHHGGEVTVFSDWKGLGDRLLEEADRLAFDMGLSELWAKVGAKNDRSANLFLRNDYEYDAGLYRKTLHYRMKYGLTGDAERFPPMIVLGYVYVCNAHCPYCPYTAHAGVRESFKDAHFMPDPIFNRIADEAGPHKSVLRFTGGGEPFLHPDIAKHAAYAAERGCKVSIITNGSQDVSSVIDVADMIEFSVDAGTEADYRKARPGLNWETLNRNVQDAISKRHRTHIIVSIIKQRGIDLDEARRHWSFVDAVQMRKFLSFGTEQDNSADHTPYLPNAEKVPCPWLFDRVLINSRGHYTLCNIDIGFRFGFSSIMDRSIADVWRGREFENARLKHLTGKADELEMCKGCKDLQYRSWKFSYFKLRDYASRHSPA